MKEDEVQVRVTEEQFLERTSYLAPEQRLCVQEALDFARREHGDQRRKSGELFFIHPLTVAYYLAAYQLDAAALSAALLHDIAEDTRISIDELEQHFGREVATLVSGVTKLKDVSQEVAKGRALSREEIQDLSTQKLLLAMTDDVRVVIVKLFDRLHNMRTIKHMPRDTQVRKARETLFVFAPMANRLGIWKIKSELEALSLEVLHEAEYRLIKANLEQLRKDQEEMFQLVSGQVMDCLLEANLDVRKVLLAPENIYTVYQDLTASGASYSEVDKTMRLVVLLSDWIACYTALGHLHQLWQAVPDRFDDYISVPRDNLYRSLHTTVIHNNGQHVKIRLRTEAMDMVSQIGVLAQWKYANTPMWDKGIADRIEALSENIKETIHVDGQDASASVKSVVEDVLGRQIRVYTPRGDAIELAQGATPIDFAYAIHTRLGDQCQRAYVNEILAPLNKPLRSGDQVQIVRSANAEPQREWLDEDLGYIATNYARSHARRWFRRLPREAAVAQGKQILQAELRMLGLIHYSHQSVAKLLGYNRAAELYYALGRAELLPTVLSTRILDEKWTEEPVRSLDNVVIAPSGEKHIVTHADGRPLRLCATCCPRPRDNIVGYLRKNGTVTVHRAGCHSLRTNRSSKRLMKLGWGEAAPRKARILTLQVDVYDRPGLLHDITNLMHDEQINITYIHTPPDTARGEKRINLRLEVVRPRQAVRILHQIQALVNVYAVRCLPASRTLFGEDGESGLYRPE